MSIFKKWLLDFCVYSGVLSGLIIALFYPLGIELVHEWRSDPEFSHGFLIPAVSVYIICIERRKILQALSNRNRGKFNTGGLLLLLSGLIIFVFGTFIQHIFIQGIALLMVLSGIIDFLLGFTILRALWFPIGYLFFMLPIPYAANRFFAHRLKFFVAESSGLLLSLAGIPVLLEKNMLHLASISLEIVEACSGMQTMISFLAIGSVFAYFGYRSNILRGVIIAAAIPLSVLANIFRVSTIGALSYYFNNDLAHDFHRYAWTLIVLIGVLGFAAIDVVLSRYMKRPSIARDSDGPMCDKMRMDMEIRRIKR